MSYSPIVTYVLTAQILILFVPYLSDTQLLIATLSCTTFYSKYGNFCGLTHTHRHSEKV